MLAKMRHCKVTVKPLLLSADRYPFSNMVQLSYLYQLLASILLFITTDAFQISSTDLKATGGDLIWKQELSVRTRASESSNTRRRELPPVIQQIADERAEFQINLGRAMDTLRRDMPDILSRTPGPLGIEFCSCCATCSPFAFDANYSFFLLDRLWNLS
jgi:hypothetical protein